MPKTTKCQWKGTRQGKLVVRVLGVCLRVFFKCYWLIKLWNGIIHAKNTIIVVNATQCSLYIKKDRIHYIRRAMKSWKLKQSCYSLRSGNPISLPKTFFPCCSIFSRKHLRSNKWNGVALVYSKIGNCYQFKKSLQNTNIIHYYKMDENQRIF